MKTHLLFIALLGLGFRAELDFSAQQIKVRNEIDALLPKATNEKGEHVPEVIAQLETLEAAEKNFEMLARQANKQKELAKIPEDQRFRQQFQASASEEKDLSKFSLSKFLRASIDGSALSGIELEVHQLGEQDAKNSQVNVTGRALPPIIIAAMGQKFRNDMTATGGSGGNQGGNFIQTNLRSALGPLYERSVCAGLGATMLSGLSGYVDIPTYGDTTPQTVKAENADADEATSATGLINLRPRRLPVVIDISKMLLMLSNESVDLMMYNHLLTRFGLKVDNYALNGTGSSNQPYGVFNTTGVTAIGSDTNGAALTWASAVAFETAVAIGNADFGSLGWATNPAVRGKLLTTEKASNTAQFIWTDANTVRGYKTAVTTAIPSNGTKGSATAVCSSVAFGNWNDLLMASWGGIDVENVTDRAGAIAGLKSMVLTGFFDSVVQRAASFAIKKDVLTA